MQGRIIKGIAGFYYVQCGTQVYECKARGRFRNEAKTPMVGDIVEFEQGYLMELLPRKNELVRPMVANVDQFVLVLSASKPTPDFLLADKLLIQAQLQKSAPLIVLNKSDQSDGQILQAVQEEYADYANDFVLTSAKTGEGVDLLLQRLTGKLSCFAGQSAVGKSSLLNALCTKFILPIGEISKRLGRGKHTTRASELLDLSGLGYAMDTPGFSLLDIGDVEPEHLGDFYQPMRILAQRCRFAQCLHDAEPDCAVKLAVQQGHIAAQRYKRYLLLLNQLKEKREKRYD